jgi:hypothetical protein
MAKYHLVHIDTKSTFFNLTRLEMVNKLKQAGDLQNWFCWYPGITQWKQVSQASEIKEWMATPWTDDQAMPPWQDLFTKRSRQKNEDFEIVEFNETPGLTPPPLPSENEPGKTEFVISGFSGQVFDFDENLKDKHYNNGGFKIIDENSSSPVDDSNNKLDKTVTVNAASGDFEKTAFSSTQLISENTVANGGQVTAEKVTQVTTTTVDTEKTATAVAPPPFMTDKTVKVDMSGRDFDKTMTSTTALTTEKTKTGSFPAEEIENTNKTEQPVAEMTITKELTPMMNKGAPEELPSQLANQQAAAQAAANKKHNRRYPRIKGRLRTIITNKSKAFMTFTKDISLGGIYVENNIPQDILNSEIEVYLSDPSGKKSILFRCHPVGDMKNPCRFSFAKADEKNLLKLSQWLDDLAKISAA